MIVLDASAATELLIRPAGAESIAGVLEGEDVKVPAHFDVEVYGAIRDAVRRRWIDPSHGELALLQCARLNAERVAVTGLLAEAYGLRDRFGRGDVFYAVLARREGATLLTSDAHFARAAAGYTDVRLTVPA